MGTNEKTTTLKAVMVSVTYHRNCFIIVNEGEDLETAVREQIRMPGDPLLDPSEWSEDEFAVIDVSDSVKVTTTEMKPASPSSSLRRQPTKQSCEGFPEEIILKSRYSDVNSKLLRVEDNIYKLWTTGAYVRTISDYDPTIITAVDLEGGPMIEMNSILKEGFVINKIWSNPKVDACTYLFELVPYKSA